MATPITGLEHFGAKLFSTISQKNNTQNVFLSPASISLAVSMCATGAGHETLEQMLRVLEVSSTNELTNIADEIMQVFPAGNHNIPSTDETAVESTDKSTGDNGPVMKVIYIQDFPNTRQPKPLELRLVNRLYAQKEYEIQQQYLDLIEKSFHSDVKLEDFKNESAKAVQTINKWVEVQTNKKICDILSTNDIKRDTRLVLLNCIYFKGEWRNKFKETSTNKNADFHEDHGNISRIELMYQQTYHDYAENKDLHVQIAHLPYSSDSQDVRFVFTIVLPNKGVSLVEVERKLTSNLQLRQQILSNESATSAELEVYLPKFKLETSYELSDILVELGMKDAFNDKKADFEGIIGKVNDANRICISKVIHKTFINVNEEGTEAAAATAVTMQLCGCAFGVQKPKPIEFKADRPFLFFIREINRNLVLFSGKFVSPAASNK